jgi:hypothetical protein
MRRLLRHRPSPAMIVALLALFVALGGVGYAATKIGSAQIRNNSIRSQDIRNGTIRGKDVHRKTIAAKQIKNPEPYHEIGAGGEPAFQNGAKNFVPSGGAAPSPYSSAAFLKDNEGFVHLKGTVTATHGKVAFTLPARYRPRRILDIGVIAGTPSGNSIGYVYVHPNGDVELGGVSGAANYGLDSVSFRAGG